ncbi:hypothetical protein [Planococcus salinarum]|uniref:hypothetical protein n=1 Tax=Planococcus salinarum TaxID=622695 RepID=UPI000E3D6869|nr:hypothetical protein [Planococcus salinarum]TAA66093.1 hypothetical protein D2909_15600 [Planococcus salinarum]
MKDIVIKAKRILEGIEVGFFDTGKEWSSENYADYYRYFSHPNKEVRKYSLLVFAAAVGNWWMKSAFVFYSHADIIYYSDLKEHLDKIYFIEDYFQAFLANKVAIKEEFPLLYNAIVVDLIKLDNENQFENVYPSVDPQLFFQLRETWIKSNIDTSYEYNFNDLLREVGLPTFLKD